MVETMERTRHAGTAADGEAVRSDLRVYCGPSIKGVARQYEMFQWGLPAPLKELVERHPDAGKLLVSPARFPEMRKRLDTPGTPEAGLYRELRRVIAHGHPV